MVACACMALRSCPVHMELFAHALGLDGLFHNMHFATVGPGPGWVPTRVHCCDHHTGCVTALL
jgi:hypothetical protein